MFWQSQRELTLKKELDKVKCEKERLKDKSDSKDTKKANKIGNLNERIVNLEKIEKRLRDNITDLNAKKEREEDLIKHNTKILMEKKEVEFEKKVADIEKEKDVAIAKVKDEYRDKVEKQLETRGSEMKEMYTDVLSKLTGVTGTLNKPATSSNVEAS